MSSSQPTPPSLDELLAAAQRGSDVDAWRALVARITPRIFRVARGLTAWRVLGAQTIVEHAWRAALRAPGAMDDSVTLRRRLMTEVVARALALGDSPRDRTDEGADEARLAAMRAVALLPNPSRAVLVLADIGGVPLAEVAKLLNLPTARLKAELWHARLAVDTLRGAGAVGSPTPPTLAAVESVPCGGDEDDCAGVAELWREPAPAALLDRLASDLHDRSQRRRLAPGAIGSRLPVLGGLLGALLLAAGAALSRESSPRVARLVPPARPAAVAAPGVEGRDSTATPARPRTDAPAGALDVDRRADQPGQSPGSRIAHRHPDSVAARAAGD